jgi:hypothetical protein
MTQRQENPEMNLNEMNLNEMNPTYEQLEELLRSEIDETNKIIKIKHKTHMLDIFYYRRCLKQQGGKDYNYFTSFFNECMRAFYCYKNVRSWLDRTKNFKDRFKTLNCKDNEEYEELNKYILAQIEEGRYKRYFSNDFSIVVEDAKKMYYYRFNYPNYKQFKNQLL